MSRCYGNHVIAVLRIKRASLCKTGLKMTSRLAFKAVGKWRPNMSGPPVEYLSVDHTNYTQNTSKSILESNRMTNVSHGSTCSLEVPLLGRGSRRFSRSQPQNHRHNSTYIQVSSEYFGQDYLCLPYHKRTCLIGIIT